MVNAWERESTPDCFLLLVSALARFKLDCFHSLGFCTWSIQTVSILLVFYTWSIHTVSIFLGFVPDRSRQFLFPWVLHLINPDCFHSLGFCIWSIKTISILLVSVPDRSRLFPFSWFLHLIDPDCFHSLGFCTWSIQIQMFSPSPRSSERNKSDWNKVCFYLLKGHESLTEFV